jgi:hypothetical protein
MRFVVCAQSAPQKPLVLKAAAASPAGVEPSAGESASRIGNEVVVPSVVWSSPAGPHTATGMPAAGPAEPLCLFDFEGEVAIFLHKRVGIWTISDVYMVFGAPLRRRMAMDSGPKSNGQIPAYADPTHTYRELELDFGQRGILRSVFVYPVDLTWVDCRRLWGANVRSTQANKGRIFYSYQNRRLDVLVDVGGKVISLGLY